ncbi:hypothetical protein E4U52_004078 [Claviceps spartinae]|nr:hypothetical protein E4U52_004078 [Claviceps spartinae]
MGSVIGGPRRGRSRYYDDHSLHKTAEPEELAPDSLPYAGYGEVHNSPRRTTSRRPRRPSSSRTVAQRDYSASTMPPPLDVSGRANRTIFLDTGIRHEMPLQCMEGQTCRDTAAPMVITTSIMTTATAVMMMITLKLLKLLSKSHDDTGREGSLVGMSTWSLHRVQDTIGAGRGHTQTRTTSRGGTMLLAMEDMGSMHLRRRRIRALSLVG